MGDVHAKRLIGIGAVTGAAGLLLGWPAWIAVAWARYGRPPREAGLDPLLDRFLPAYEVADTHEIRVNAPAALAFAVAEGTGLQRSRLVRAIGRARERLMRVRGESAWPPGGIVAQMRGWGWAVLAEAPGREVVLGAVTQPWRGDVRFDALPTDEFLAFGEPGYVKIVTALSVEPLGAERSIFRVRTRVAATDPMARARFRRYWATFSPGIVLIRRAALRTVKRDAERRHRVGRAVARGGGVPATPRAPATAARVR